MTPGMKQNTRSRESPIAAGKLQKLAPSTTTAALTDSTGDQNEETPLRCYARRKEESTAGKAYGEKDLSTAMR